MGVTYRKPTIGPKAYLARGPSGWVETFERTASDRSLDALLGTVPLKVAVEGYRKQQTLAKSPMEWGSVLEYLARICKLTVDLIPEPAGIAFWAQAILSADEARERLKN